MGTEILLLVFCIGAHIVASKLPNADEWLRSKPFDMNSRQHANKVGKNKSVKNGNTNESPR